MKWRGGEEEGYALYFLPGKKGIGCAARNPQLEESKTAWSCRASRQSPGDHHQYQ
jgi:hypothetical protein